MMPAFALLLLLAASDLDRAIADLRAGRYQEAETQLAQIAAAKPESAPTWKALGESRAALGNLAGAEQSFQKACDLDPATELACYYLGTTLFNERKYDLSLKALARALQHDAKNAWRIERGIAITLDLGGAAGPAEEHFRRSIGASPRKPPPAEDPRTDYGAFLLKHGRAAAAIPPLEAAVLANPVSARPRVLLGRALIEVGRYDAAEPHLEAALEAEPNNAEIKSLLDRVRARLERREN